MNTTTHYPAAPTAQGIESHTLSVIVDNEPGVLARVIGLFSGRGYNIDSLTVSETEHEKHLSRITIVTRGTPMVIEQIKNQLERLVPVHRVVDMTVAGPALQRELAMVKVRGRGEQRVEALRLADAFRASVIDASTESFVFEITGASDKIESLHQPDAAARTGRGLAHRHRGDRARAGGHVRPMEQRLSLITLGVRDLEVSRRFYEALGWRAAGVAADGVVFFQLGGVALSLYGRSELAADLGVADAATGFSAVTLAYNGRDKAEVDAVLTLAVRSGGRLLKAAKDAAWGGYVGYFADPDGHLWEVAWNPHFLLREDGSIALPA